MTMSTGPKQGWGWPVNSLKSHFFTESRRSLCMRWAYLGALEACETPPPEACKECTKRLAKYQTVSTAENRP